MKVTINNSSYFKKPFPSYNPDFKEICKLLNKNSIPPQITLNPPQDNNENFYLQQYMTNHVELALLMYLDTEDLLPHHFQLNAIKITLGIFQKTHQIHSLGICHNDIHESNILVYFDEKLPPEESFDLCLIDYDEAKLSNNFKKDIIFLRKICKKLLSSYKHDAFIYLNFMKIIRILDQNPNDINPYFKEVEKIIFLSITKKWKIENPLDLTTTLHHYTLVNFKYIAIVIFAIFIYYLNSNILEDAQNTQKTLASLNVYKNTIDQDPVTFVNLILEAEESGIDIIKHIDFDTLENLENKIFYSSIENQKHPKYENIVQEAYPTDNILGVNFFLRTITNYSEPYSDFLLKGKDCEFYFSNYHLVYKHYSSFHKGLWSHGGFSRPFPSDRDYVYLINKENKLVSINLKENCSKAIQTYNFIDSSAKLLQIKQTPSNLYLMTKEHVLVIEKSNKTIMHLAKPQGLQGICSHHKSEYDVIFFSSDGFYTLGKDNKFLKIRTHDQSTISSCLYFSENSEVITKILPNTNNHTINIFKNNTPFILNIVDSHDIPLEDIIINTETNKLMTKIINPLLNGQIVNIDLENFNYEIFEEVNDDVFPIFSIEMNTKLNCIAYSSGRNSARLICPDISPIRYNLSIGSFITSLTMNDKLIFASNYNKKEIYWDITTITNDFTKIENNFNSSIEKNTTEMLKIQNLIDTTVACHDFDGYIYWEDFLLTLCASRDQTTYEMVIWKKIANDYTYYGAVHGCLDISIEKSNIFCKFSMETSDNTLGGSYANTKFKKQILLSKKLKLQRIKKKLGELKKNPS